MFLLRNKRSYDADDQRRDHYCHRSRETAGKERATNKNHTRDGQAPQKQAHSRISDHVGPFWQSNLSRTERFGDTPVWWDKLLFRLCVRTNFSNAHTLIPCVIYRD